MKGLYDSLFKFCPNGIFNCVNILKGHSYYNTISLSRHEQVCLSGLRFERYRLDDGRSISRNIAHWNILVQDVINLLYYQYWIDKQKYFYIVIMYEWNVFCENFKILKLCKIYKNFVSKSCSFAIHSQQIMKQHIFTNCYLKSCILQALCTSHTDFEITCHPNDKDNLEEYVTPALSTKSMNLCTEQLKKNQFCLIRCNLHALYCMWYSDGC